MEYPRKLSSGANNTVIVLSDTEVAFDNILLTEQGLRLIDVGISALRAEVNQKIFDKFIETEQYEMELFKHYFLNR